MRFPRSLRLWPVLLLAVLSPPPTPARGDVHGAFGAALDRYLTQLAGYGYSGAVLVAQHGEIVLDQGYGLADRARGTPFTAGTLFDIASISKPFTAAAVLRLEMQGKLEVEDPISRFFPAAPPDKARITLHQLLTHTAGLPESLGPEYEPLTREAFLQRIFAIKLLHPPGGRFVYSNDGYSLLAAVVEKASGRSFGDFLRSEVFLPAGMRHSGFSPDAQDRERLAHGYTGDTDWGTPLDHPHAPDGPWWNLRGNGGILTTAGDLYRWHVALQGNAVLSAAEREEYEAPKVPETHAAYPRYAYGWSVSKSPTGRRELSHVGGNGVFMSDYRRYPEDGAVIAVSSNTIGYSAVAIADQLELRLFGKSFAASPATVPAKAEELGHCAGVYELAAGESLEVAAEPGRLAVTPEGREGLEILSPEPGKKRLHRFAEREAKVEKALAAAHHGDLGPLAAILVDSTAAAERWRASLETTETQLGAWKSFAVLGTRSLGGQVVTQARLTFEKGRRELEVVWAGPTADGLSIGGKLRPTYFLPAGPSRFVTFDVGTGGTVSMSCEGAGGAAPALRFETAGGAVTARRRLRTI
jgi:CubicO group peptidase (beta-lactamase class C family)